MTVAAGRPDRGERGSVTAEFAVALPAVLALVGAALSVGAVTIAKVECVAAAQAGARHAIVTPDAGQVAAVAQRVAGGGARVEASLGEQWHSVSVSRTVRAAWLEVTVTGEAHAKAEPAWP